MQLEYQEQLVVIILFVYESVQLAWENLVGTYLLSVQLIAEARILASPLTS